MQDKQVPSDVAITRSETRTRPKRSIDFLEAIVLLGFVWFKFD